MPETRSILKRVGEDLPVPEPAFERLIGRRDRKRRNQRIAAGVVGVAIALAVAVAGTVLLRSDARPARPVPQSTSGTFAYTGDGQVFVAHSDGTTTQITHGEHEYRGLGWSPDGSRLLVLRGKTLLLMNADGSSVVELGRMRHGNEGLMSTNAHFSPDGTKIAYQSARSIFVIDVDGTHRIRITDSADDHFWYWNADFSWSPDGSRIAFAMGRYGRQGLFTVGADGTSPEQLPTGSIPMTEHPSWSPDGTRIAFSANDDRAVYVMDVDGTDRVKITSGHSPTWSPDGSKLFVDQNGRIYIVSPDGEIGNHLVGCAMLGVGWTADSNHLLVVGNANGDGPPRCQSGGAIFLADAVYASDADGPSREKLLQPSRSTFVVSPLWQPSADDGSGA